MAKRNNSSQFIISVFFSVVAVVLNYVISLALTPFITENIGIEAYGFVSLAKTFANYASIITVALNSFSSRFISVEYHKGNFKKANKYFNSVFLADIGLGVIIFLVSSVIILYLQNILSIPGELIGDVKLLFLLDMINFLILSCSTVLMSATVIKNRLELASIVKSIAYVSEAVFLIIAFHLLTPKVYLVGCGLIVSSAVIFVMNGIISRRYTPELRITRGTFSWEAVKDIVKNGIWNSINSLGNTLNTGLDLMITNMMLSPLRAGQLAIVKTISTIFTTMFQLVAQPFQPLQLKYYANEDKEKLVESFKFSIKVNGMISNIAFAGFSVFGSAYYKLWTPSQDISLLQIVSIVTVLGCIIEGAVYPLYYIYTLTLKNKVPCVITVISGLLNVTGMYVLIKFFDLGIYAVVGTTAVLSWLVNFLFNPMYSAHCLKQPLYVFYPTLIRHILSCATITAAFYGVSKIYFPTSWLTLILVAVCGLIVGVAVHTVIMFSKVERKLLIKKFVR